MAKSTKAVRRNLEGNIKLIRKANELVEARYKFDIWEIRVFAKMLTLISSDDKDLKRYDISVSDLLSDFGLHDKGDNYQAVKDAAKRLLTRVIEIERDTPEGVQWFATSMLVGTEGFKNTAERNVVRVQFHPDLKPYLLELKERYLVYDIRNLWGLSSVYSVRMYELLKQYEKIRKRRFLVEDLRLILGIAENEYPLYANLKQKVILKAQKDLEKFTDITFELEEEKDGRKITAVTFHIQSNANNRRMALPPSAQKKEATRQKVALLNSPFFNEVFEQVRLWGITETTLRAFILQHGEERVGEGLACTLEKLAQEKKPENPGGFFVRAVEEGWQSAKKLKIEQVADRKRKADHQKQQSQEVLGQAEIALDKLLDDRRGEVNEVIRSLSQDDPLLAGAAVSSVLANSFARNLLEKSTGLQLDQVEMNEWRTNKHLRDAIVREIERLHPASFSDIQKKYDEQIRAARRRVEELKP